MLRSFVRIENLLYLSHKTQKGCRLSSILATIQGILFEKQILPYGAWAKEYSFLICFFKCFYKGFYEGGNPAVFVAEDLAVVYLFFYIGVYFYK